MKHLVAKIEAEVAAKAEAAACAEFARQLEHRQAAELEQHRREVAAFMEREGLHSVGDCRIYCQRMVARMKRGQLGVHTFERWCAVLRQATVDRIVLMDPADGVLDRLRDAGVIDDANRLISIEQREAAAEARRVARVQAEEDLRARALDEALDMAGQA